MKAPSCLAPERSGGAKQLTRRWFDGEPGLHFNEATNSWRFSANHPVPIRHLLGGGTYWAGPTTSTARTPASSQRHCSTADQALVLPASKPSLKMRSIREVTWTTLVVCS